MKSLQPDETPELARRHPEEMTAELELCFGTAAALRIKARATPAGLVAVGVLVSSIILSVVPLVWAARRRR